MGKIGKTGKARDYLTSGEVAQKLGIPRRTVTQLARKELLPIMPRFGKEGHYRYPPKEIEKIVESGTHAVPGDSKVISLLKDEIRRLRQGLAQQQTYSVLRGDWVELDDTPPPEI